MSENELRAELALLSGGLLERAVRPQLSPQNESVSVGQYVIVWNGFSSSNPDIPFNLRVSEDEIFAACSALLMRDDSCCAANEDDYKFAA